MEESKFWEEEEEAPEKKVARTFLEVVMSGPKAAGEGGRVGVWRGLAEVQRPDRAGVKRWNGSL